MLLQPAVCGLLWPTCAQPPNPGIPLVVTGRTKVLSHGISSPNSAPGLLLREYCARYRISSVCMHSEVLGAYSQVLYCPLALSLRCLLSLRAAPPPPLSFWW